MYTARLLFFGLLLFIAGMVRGQGCSTLGQTPATAFPVCGSSVFTQTSVPLCVNGNIPTKCTSTGNSYQDVNPYWYKFTCFEAGTLQLTITPKDQGDDYDWQLFDVTGHDVSAVFSDASLMVAYNWSGLTGTTGTNSSSTSLFECGSFNTSNPPKYSLNPTLVQGHNYLLMISHFSGDSQSGYDLSFNGGTASITDTVPPTIKSILPNCDGARIKVILNKKMKCSSLATNGSDFLLTGTAVQPVSATGNGCSAGFDMDTIVLSMSSSIPPGNYTLKTQNGDDGNTLKDNCDNQVPTGLELPFHLAIPTPIEPDSLVPPTCAPSVLTVVFPKAIECNTIAADGSDFNVTGGSAAVTVTGASGDCDTYGETYVIHVQLSAPIVTAGNYMLHLRQGLDGNTLVDECGLVVNEGPGLAFSVSDTVSAEAYTEKVLWGCVRDTIVLGYPNINGVNSWAWVVGVGDTLKGQDQMVTYTDFNTKRFQLIVSNGFCGDTTQFSVVLDNAIHAALEVPDILCPEDAAQYKEESTGTLNSWVWDLGDGTMEQSETPGAHTYPVTGRETIYTVSLIVGNAIGCYDTAYGKIDVLRSCYIAVPSAFTPNGDGLNDYLYPLNAYKADDLVFRVFNRYGQQVFASNTWQQKWDGMVGGHPAPAGTYVWYLQYTERDTGKKFATKGTSILIR